MVAREKNRALSVNISEGRLSIVVHSLFSSWLLAFLFEGQILYSLAKAYDLSINGMVFGAMAAVFTGLTLCGFLVKTKKMAKGLILCTCIFCMAATAVFFFSPSILWMLAIIASALLSGGCVAAWSCYFKSGTPKNERIKTAADVLVYSNILMILLNMAAIHLAPNLGLALSILMLGIAFLFALGLPVDGTGSLPLGSGRRDNSLSIVKPLAFLYLFIMVITINSGLMYQVLNPAYAHLQWLTSWYWALPYIAALIIMRNLPQRTNRAYILYVAVAMMGFSFIGFMSLGRSALDYLVVNTLMLGACGVYDLFWWSILGEMLDFTENPAKVFGIGLSANVLGVLLGGFIGNAITSAGVQNPNSTLLALAVVCVTLTILPPLHKHLYLLLKDHAYLTVMLEMPRSGQDRISRRIGQLGNISERESQVISLLLQGKTYRIIAGELFISENTVKYYVKNIYSKLNIQSRTELIDIMLKEETASTRQPPK